MSWYSCRDCGKDVEIRHFNAGGCTVLCEECYERQEEEVNKLWDQYQEDRKKKQSTG